MALTFIIKPDAYEAFDNEAELIDKCKEWGLLSEKASKTKSFYYKGHGLSLACDIVGYVDDYTTVIALDQEQRHCIHPAFLKEMQASTFSTRFESSSEESGEALSGQESASLAESSAGQPKAVVTEEPVKRVSPPAAVGVSSSSEPGEEKVKKARIPKLQLPEEKVKMTATIQEFATVPNHFTEVEDEVIIYDAVSILEPEMEVGAAWSSYSATLKKLELQVGDVLTFECKVVAKKLTKHPVAYKINNPAKIQKV